MQNVARRKLRMINNALNINDLRVPPANQLEKFAENLQEFYSIRVNKQYRIISIWIDDNAYKVEITDYH